MCTKMKKKNKPLFVYLGPENHKYVRKMKINFGTMSKYINFLIAKDSQGEYSKTLLREINLISKTLDCLRKDDK